MKAKSRFLVTLLAVLYLTASAAAADQARVLVTTVFDTKSDSPIQITSRTGTTNDLLSAVEFRNNSGKTVIRFQLGWLIAVPEGCSKNPAEPTVAVASPDRVTVAPGGTANTKDYRLDMGALVSRAKSEGIVLLNVQVGVVRVDFLDSSSWETPVQGNLFMPDALQFEKKKCSGGKLLPEALISTCGRRPMKEPLAEGSSPGWSTDAGPDIHCFYYCQGTTIPEYCQNNLSSCTDKVCPQGGCANQECIANCG